MKRLAFAIVVAALELGGCVAPVGPVSVTRFHAADVTRWAGEPSRLSPHRGRTAAIWNGRPTAPR